MSLVATLILVLARLLNLAILARILLSWIPMDRHNPIATFIYEITEPLVGPIRRVMPAIAGFDFSPMVAMILIGVAERVLLTMLSRWM